ncbi:probable G-protein coupled receptor 33 [Zootoca vivipara]|uniref:probable G-protein coupled receptor 33 n=1 Tax=Zootoca vivipara TaxID=8524 RepID=UPI00293BC837|nr:probable G-protein coupled receptor 33 [Zootoca vivipara]
MTKEAGLLFSIFLQGFMETTILENASSTVRTNASHSYVAIRPMNLTIACFISLSFLVGAAVNGLFLWVLGVKMKRSVNTLWFLHLILTHLISSWNMPFYVAYILLGFHWAFGTVTCKLVNSLGSLGMFNTVFLLTIINLDRYLLTCHPIWSQHNRTICRAQRLVTGVWLLSLALSAPYLAFRETREVENGRLVCDNNYAFSNDWDDEKTKALRYRVQFAFFVTRFLLAFLVPFMIIMGCSYCIAQEMKKKKLVRRTKKPFRILVASVASFFISWLPYHLYHASVLLEGSGMMGNVLKPIFITGACFNFCFTPILYIFVGEKFQQVFKTSVLALAQKAFLDEPITSAYNINLTEGVGRETIDRSSLVLTVT